MLDVVLRQANEGVRAVNTSPHGLDSRGWVAAKVAKIARSNEWNQTRFGPRFEHRPLILHGTRLSARKRTENTGEVRGMRANPLAQAVFLLMTDARRRFDRVRWIFEEGERIWPALRVLNLPLKPIQCRRKPRSRSAAMWSSPSSR